MMIRMRLSQAASRLDAKHQGADVEFQGVSTDSRSLQVGNLFVALAGARFDAHDCVDQAVARGATAAILSRPVATPIPTLPVADTRLALGRLASAWRKRFTIPVIAVTGSNGKTTVKEMIAAIFRQTSPVLSEPRPTEPRAEPSGVITAPSRSRLGCRGSDSNRPVLVTQGNLNNDIGLPLTLLCLDATHEVAVIEIGANHPGEVDYLTRITRPTVALVTNAAPAHLEGFGSIEGVARAKGEIFAGLAEEGIAVINADDPHAGLWQELAGKWRSVSFGLKAEAEVSATWEPKPQGSLLRLRTPEGALDITLHLPGRHNVMNALAAGAAAYAAGAGLASIKAGLEIMRPVHGRLEIKNGPHDTCIIDDTYNANPASLQVALDVLAGYPAGRWLALGDMGELGSASASLHIEAGRQARGAGVARLFATGGQSRLAVEAFGAGAQHFAGQEELIAALREELARERQVTLLVKGSRAARMERVVAMIESVPES